MDVLLNVFLVILHDMYVLLNVLWLFCKKCMCYLSFFNYFLLGSCSEALSLTNPLRKGLITDWSLSEAVSFTNPLRKGLITDWSCSEAYCFSNTNPLRKGLITDWSCSEALSFTNPV